MQASGMSEQRGDEPEARSAELRLEGFSLLVPHRHVHSMEPVQDLGLGRVDGAAVGELTVDGQRWPVYCLDRDLAILTQVPASRRHCVLLRARRGGFGILCDEVTVVDNAGLRMLAVPGCMRGAQSPVESLAVHGDRVTCVLSVERLAAMLRPDQALHETHSDPHATFIEARE